MNEDFSVCIHGIERLHQCPDCVGSITAESYQYFLQSYRERTKRYHEHMNGSNPSEIAWRATVNFYDNYVPEWWTPFVGQS